MTRELELLDRVESAQPMAHADWLWLLEHRETMDRPALYDRARAVREREFGFGIHTRGLIEISSFCKNDCYYCGLRRSNAHASRYRLTKEQILDCCETGWKLGFRTFVLQSGEDAYYTDERMCDIVSEIHRRYPEAAITLSLGERSEESYRRLKEAGADRYLLRHETATDAHYRMLHPPELLLEHRKECLFTLKRLGYQVGAGFMVGSPGQTNADLARDFQFLDELQPQMIGIGPFVPHHDTPFAQKPGGTVEDTLFCLALLRLRFPKVLLPATTALGTIDSKGRERGILAGANVVMPNLSPVDTRKQYELYDNKICTGEEAAESRAALEARMQAIGCHLTVDRGDAPGFEAGGL